MSFTVLFVCTGNICRSPIAELLARSLFDDRLGDAARAFTVGSAGTWGHEGSRMEPEALHALAARGIDGNMFRARELTREMVDGGDLILAATREHAVAAATLDPTSKDRIFLMTEFARLLATADGAHLPVDPAERARAIVAAAAARRSADAENRADPDLADPYGAPERVFAKTAAHVESLLAPLLGLLSAPNTATPGSSAIAHAGIVRP
ncbi:MAG: low molecular weight protein-tyrosine phosphatase [Frankiaceae bacterium]|nr:low molecular weight protein-tyrosine phosphatase [Frankiaceae bacterium]